MATTHAGAPEALRAEELTKAYGSRLALRGVSFSAVRGERVAVIGPNGAGKTTLLQILAGAMAPTGGRVSLHPREVGWVPQQPALYSKLSVAENLRLFARLERAKPGERRRGWRRSRSGGRSDEAPGSSFDVERAVARMLEQTGLADRAGDEVGRLSGGNRQRVNLAIGLLRDPRVLLLDEPSSSLDPRQRERLWEFLGSLEATVVFSTHDAAEAERHGERLLVLADGELLFDGPPAELDRATASPDLETAFVAFLRERGH